MAIHRDLEPDWRGAAARVAMAALSETRGNQTAPNGTVSIRNADGTRTVIGVGAGTDGTGAPVGVRQFVGDTTPPGRPAGVTFMTVDGCVTGVWDGTLDGGVPADFERVDFLADVGGTESCFGSVSVAGLSTSARYPAGTVAACRAVAYDASGNASEASEAVTLTVAVPSEELAAKADELARSVETVSATVNGQKTALGELSTRVEGAASDADAALEAATEAKQTASGLTTKVTEATTTADEALTRASSAQQTAASLKSTVESDYLKSADAEATYSTKTEVEQTASGLTAKVESAESGVGTLQTLIRASGTGVEVAKKVDGSYTSTKTLMDDTGFSVLDKAGTVLSKFGSSLVELGRNSVNAVIEMCGGALRISTARGGQTNYANLLAPSDKSGVSVSCDGTAPSGAAVGASVTVGRYGDQSEFRVASSFERLVNNQATLHHALITAFSDASQSRMGLSAETLTVIGKTLVIENPNGGIPHEAPLCTEWTYLWKNGSDRFVRWCVRMGVCYLQAHRVNGLSSSGWKAGTLPASVRPDHSLWQPATPRQENNTAQLWVGGTEESDGGGPVWLYSNGSDDVSGIMSWPIG